MEGVIVSTHQPTYPQDLAPMLTGCSLGACLHTREDSDRNDAVHLISRFTSVLHKLSSPHCN